jgi:hypothetical protein
LNFEPLNLEPAEGVEPLEHLEPLEPPSYSDVVELLNLEPAQ